MGVDYYYCTGHPSDVANEVRTSLAQQAGPNDFVTVGITNDPEKRFDKLKNDSAQSNDSCGRLVVIYEALSKDHYSQVESILVKWLREHDYQFETEEYIDVGGSGNDGRDLGPYYVYLLLDRESRQG